MSHIITWRVDGLHDAIHERVIEQTLKVVKGVTGVEVSSSQRRVGVEFEDGADSEPLDSALAELKKLGYDFNPEQSSRSILQNTPSQNIVMVTSAKNRKKGLFFLIAPFAGLVLILTCWAITSFVLSRLLAGSSPSSDTTTIANIVNIALGFLGILCVIGIPVGLIVGILYLKKREPVDPSKYDSRSGKGESSVIPPEAKGWNWGAFGLSILWGIYYNVWISLWCFVPIVGFFVSIYLGVKGNELAWKKNGWISVDDFQKAQKKWQAWGIIAFILSILYVLGSFSNAGSENNDYSMAQRNIVAYKVQR